MRHAARTVGYRLKTWLALAVLVVASGCGGDDDDDDGRTDGTTTGGAANEGGQAPGGAASEGGSATAAGGTGGTDAVPGTCSPVQRGDPPSVTCPDYDTRPVGIARDAPGVTVTSVELPSTIVPGNDFALSLVTESGEADVQLWGTSEECGTAFEGFQSGGGTRVHVTPGATCWDVLAISPHSHVLIIREESAGYVSGEFITCALGSC